MKLNDHEKLLFLYGFLCGLKSKYPKDAENFDLIIKMLELEPKHKEPSPNE